MFQAMITPAKWIHMPGRITTSRRKHKNHTACRLHELEKILCADGPGDDVRYPPASLAGDPQNVSERSKKRLCQITAHVKHSRSCFDSSFPPVLLGGDYANHGCRVLFFCLIFYVICRCVLPKKTRNTNITCENFQRVTHTFTGYPPQTCAPKR